MLRRELRELLGRCSWLVVPASPTAEHRSRPCLGFGTVLAMSPKRLEAFSDGVIAIIITIMVLELRPPEGSGFDDLKPLVPKALAYLLSFVLVAIYWNNHHHLFKLVERID